MEPAVWLDDILRHWIPVDTRDKLNNMGGDLVSQARQIFNKIKNFATDLGLLCL